MVVCPRVIVISLNFLDVALATLFLLKSNFSWKSWQNASADLTFCSFTVDLWCITICRFALIFGAIFGLKVNPVQGSARLKLSRRPIYCLAFAIIVYVLSKFLASTECMLGNDSKMWLWLFFGQTCMFSLVFSWCWWVLGNESPQHPLLVINADEEAGSLMEDVVSTSSSDSDSESTNSDDSGNVRFVLHFEKTTA